MLLVSPSRWWLLGILALLNLSAGIVDLACAEYGLSCVVIVFGGIAVLQGVGLFILSLKERHYLQHWWLNGISALFSLGPGVLLLFCEVFVVQVSKEFLSTIIGLQILAQGALSIAVSIDMKREFKIKRFVAAYALIALIAGCLLIVLPYFETNKLIAIIAIYSIFASLLLSLDAFRVRRMIR